MKEREAASALLLQAISDRAFPGAAVEVGNSRGVIWRDTFGRLTFEESTPPVSADTIFDLASLAKPVVTTTVVMDLLVASTVSLEEALARGFPEWRGADRPHVTVRDLLEHASGLPARLVDAPPPTRREFEHDICGIALEYEPRTRSIYSDLGFILLGFLADDRGHADLASQFRAIWEPLAGESSPPEFLGFHVPAERLAGVAPTTPLPDDLRRGRVLVGEVHDSYAAQLGGIAGHSGLFGDAPAVGRFARAMLSGARGNARMRGPFAPGAIATATRKSAVPGSSRALGWDTMLPTSSCGTRLSPAAFGHVGFTGTSLWIDPELDRYFVLLTNRVFGPGTPDQMRAVRRSLHDILATIDG